MVFSVCAGIIFPNITRAVKIDASGIFSPIICVPKDEPDPETDCRACGDNARTEYEQCRQSYYLKKQTQLLESQKTTGELETKNQEFQELLDKQNKQIEELIQDTKLLNIGLFIILAAILFYLVLNLIRKKWKK